jgi:hypothetical protein
LMQIKIQRARPPSLMCMKLIFDLKTSLEKICSLLGKSAQTCAEIVYHVPSRPCAFPECRGRTRANAHAK